jgi:hypothetical protein
MACCTGTVLGRHICSKGDSWTVIFGRTRGPERSRLRDAVVAARQVDNMSHI